MSLEAIVFGEYLGDVHLSFRDQVKLAKRQTFLPTAVERSSHAVVPRCTGRHAGDFYLVAAELPQSRWHKLEAITDSLKQLRTLGH